MNTLFGQEDQRIEREDAVNPNVRYVVNKLLLWLILVPLLLILIIALLGGFAHAQEAYHQAPIKVQESQITARARSDNGNGSWFGRTVIDQADLQDVYVMDGSDVYRTSMSMKDLLACSPKEDVLKFRIETDKHGKPKHLFAVDTGGHEHKLAIFQ